MRESTDLSLRCQAADITKATIPIAGTKEERSHLMIIDKPQSSEL